MSSRYGRQALAEGLRPGFGSSGSGAVAVNSAPKSVLTSLAGFAEAGLALAAMAGISDAESVITFMAGFNAAGSVITSMAGFACGGQPHPPGGRTAIPASFK
jgi:hypothetical protein